MRVVDLTFPIRPHFRWKVATELKGSHAKGDLFQVTILTIHCHAFTHVDAPLHFLPGGKHIAEMPVDQWVGEAAVVDLTHVRENGEVTPLLIALLAVLVISTYWPGMVMFIPNLFRGIQ